MTLAYCNLTSIEIRWLCRRYKRFVSQGESSYRWFQCGPTLLRNVLYYLKMQLMAYPCLRNLAIDFIGWNTASVLELDPSRRPRRAT